MKPFRIAVRLGPLALITFLALWAVLIEPRRLVVHREQLALPHWPSAAPLRVALLAGWVAPEPIANALGALRAPLGVIAVLGNHDWWNDGERTRRAFEQVGIVVLENRAWPVRRAVGSFYVVGLADELTRPQAIDSTLAQVPPGEPYLVLVHEPDVFPEIHRSASLTLAGHTHGGQVRLPLLGPPVVPSRYGQRFAAGHVVEGGRHLFVTSGIGTSIWPVRFGVPPEIALLTLQAE